ncbi:MAG: hypothetical protein ACYC4H_07230 [Desulfocucumaceae bacterium]
MLTGVDVKSGGELGRPGSSLEIWTCGCTAVGSVTSINARCISCGNVFNKTSKKNKLPDRKKGKTENVRIELVNNIQTLTDAGEEVHCPQCEGSGEIKVFTQEWDRIKSHMSPCPSCRSGEWLDWLSGKRIVGEKNL